MEGNTNYFLKFVPFSKFDLWDTKRYTSKLVNSNFEIVKLSSCIKEENKKYKLFLEEEKDFGILGVNNKSGIFDAYVQKGKEINQPYKKMEIGWIAYNPYRINVGSIGIRLEEHTNEYISPAYVVFSCKENLLPEYLFLVFKTDTFNNVINENTTGSVRQNLSFAKLKDLEIPLPSIGEQQALVDAYFAKINEATQLEEEANNIDLEIEKYLFTELGISVGNKTENKKGLNVVEFSQLERWDTLYLLNNINEATGKYKNVKFSNIITSFNREGNKSIRVDSSIKFPLDKFNYIGMENIEKETGKLLEFQKVFGKEIKSQTLRVPKDYFIYGKLRPYLNKYWINFTYFENIICSSEFFVFDISENINKVFFREVLASQFIQEQISDKTSGARMPRINEDIFYNLYFPMPPLEIQIKIAKATERLRYSKNEKLVLSERLKHQANEEFEKAIFQ